MSTCELPRTGLPQLPDPGSRAALLGRAAILAAMAALGIGGYLSLALSGRLNPVSGVLSASVYFGAGRWLLIAAVALLAVSGILLLLAWRAASLPLTARARTGLTLWVTGLVLVGLVPSDPTGTASTTAGLVHRDAGALFLSCLPLAGWELRNGMRGDPRLLAGARRVGLVVLVAAVTAATFGIGVLSEPAPGSRLPVTFPADVRGLLERVAMVAEVAVVVLLARVAVDSSGRLRLTDRHLPVGALLEGGRR
ncbi:MAG: DUF998 domain-containing protein [Geodermatophilaceae bacterium]